MPHDILIIDDEELVRDAIAMVLERNGFNPTTLPGAKEALEICDKEVFDLIITDLVMPEIDGVGLIKTLRERDIQTPIITLTGGARLGQHNMSEQALDAGAAEALQKPVDKQQLLGAIERALTQA